MRRLLGHLTSLCLVLSLFAWLPSTSPGPVLCFEPTGRVRVEAAADCCGDVVSIDRTPQAFGAVARDACGPCTDVRLSGQEGQLAPSPKDVPQPLPAVALLGLSSMAAFDAWPAWRAVHVGRDRPASSQDRPSVLRI